MFKGSKQAVRKKIIAGRKAYSDSTHLLINSPRAKVGDKWINGLAVSEAAERDYKDEYKKFQSSGKSKKYRAELNKYNRDHDTYGNGDGKDASHKGGKISGFEASSVNKGRAEKSRLKQEEILMKKSEQLVRKLIREEVKRQIKEEPKSKKRKRLVESAPGYDNREFGDPLPTLADTTKMYADKNIDEGVSEDLDVELQDLEHAQENIRTELINFMKEIKTIDTEMYSDLRSVLADVKKAHMAFKVNRARINRR